VISLSDSLVSASAVWDLCLALWGDLEGQPSVATVNEQFEESYACQLARREALSRWLSARANKVIRGELLSATNKVSLVCSSVFTFVYNFNLCI